MNAPDTGRPGPLLLALALLAGCNPVSVGGSGPDASPGDQSSTPPDASASAMLAAHDAVRAQALPTPTPPLAPLGWSNAAASAAQSWADRCTWAHDPALGTLGMGQNLYAAGSSTGTFGTDSATVVAAWAAEAADYDYATDTCATGKVCGHYTQIVWRSTASVGCAHRVCSTGSPFGSGMPNWDLWVCNYVPPGNVMGERPY
jgi:pathogenesis-related protein 1